MKRIMPLFIVIALCVSMFSNVNAVSFTTENQTSDVITVYTEDEFIDIFQKTSDDKNHQAYTLTKSDLKNLKVVYSYNFSYNQNIKERANAVVNCTFYVNKQIFHSVFSGTVTAYELSWGDIFWTGPISGGIKLNGINYRLIAGFSKLDSDPAIQMDVTIEAQNEQDAVGFAIFSFGEDVMTTEINQDISSRNGSVETGITNAELRNNTNLQTTATNAAFQFVGSSSGTIPISSGNLSGQTVNGYFDRTQNIFAVSLKTYGDSLENWYSSWSLTTPETNVSSCEVVLTSNNYGSGSNSSWIDGVCSFGFSPSNFNSGTVVIKALFADLLSILGIPTSTISLILDGVEGKVEKDVYANTATMGLSFGMGDTADFDASSVGLPFAFQLDRVGSSYTGNSSYTFSSSLTYCTWCWPSNANHPKYFYNTAYDATRTVTITLG